MKQELDMLAVQELIEESVEKSVAKALAGKVTKKEQNKLIYIIAYGFLAFLIIDWVFFNHFTVDGWTIIPTIDPDYKSMINVMMYSVMGSLLTLAGVIINNKDKKIKPGLGEKDNNDA